MTTPRLRTGRRVGQTLYLQTGPEPADTDLLIGLLDTPDLAALVVAAVNADDDARALLHPSLR